MKKIKAAIIGAGFIGTQHISAIRRLPLTEVVAIVGSNEERTKESAVSLGIPYFYTSVPELLEKHPDLDVVHNCTPNALHYEFNKLLIEAGVNIYCEKPFTLNAAESAELIDLMQHKNIKGGINYNYRNNLMVIEMKERVERKLIGEVWFVNLEYIQDWLLFETDYDWRMDADMGGESRAIGDIGSHCFDTIQYITGEKIVAVEAKTLKKFNNRYLDNKQIPINNEDAAIIFLTFESGLNGLVRVSQVTPGKKNDFHILIEGDDQSLEWYQEQPDRLLIGNRDRGNEEIYAASQYLTGEAAQKAVLPNGHAVGWHDALTQGIDNFYQALQTDQEANYVSFEEAHHIMKVIDACVESAKQEKKITIN